MKHLVAVLFVILYAITGTVSATTISYKATHLGGTDYRFTYTLENDSLSSAIEEITIYFDPAVFRNIAVGPDQPPGWTDAIAVAADPDLLPGLSGFGFVDVLAGGAGLAPGAALEGITVLASFIGTGPLPPQWFQIIDPATFAVRDEGQVLPAGEVPPPTGVPEPGALALLLAGLVAAAAWCRIARDTRSVRTARRPGSRQELAGRAPGRNRTLLGACAASCLLLLGGCGDNTRPGLDAGVQTLAGAASTQEPLSVSGLQKVSETRVGRTTFDYEFKVTVRNDDTALRKAVRAVLKSAGPGTTITSASVAVGDIPAGKSLTSQARLKLRHDRTYPLNLAALGWELRYTLPQKGATVQVVKEAGEHVGLVVTKPGGEAVEYAGERDVNGVLVSIDEITHRTAKGKTIVRITGPDSRETVAPNGVRGRFEATSDGGLLVSFTEPVSGNVLKTKIGGSANLAAAGKSLPAGMRAPGPRYAGMTVPAPKAAASATGTARLLAAAASASHANQIPVDIRTANCGVAGPANGTVFVGLRAGEYSGTYKASAVSPGLYRAYLPAAARDVAVSTANLNLALRGAKEAINALCSVDPVLIFNSGSLICVQVSAALAGSTVFAGTPAAVAILAACEASVAATVAYCEFKAFFGPPTPGTPGPGVPDPVGDTIDNVADYFISKLPAHYFEAEATPFIDALPQPITGPTVKFSPLVASLALSINNFSVVVGELTISPPSPAQFESYVASAKVICLPAGSVSVISVLGTDGYRDARSYPASGAEQTVSLAVPGAQSGVSDTIDLVVTPSLGSGPITKRASLVFK